MQTQAGATRIVLVKDSDSGGTVRPLAIAVCCAVMLAALIVGVGVPNHMVLRHIIQTLPLWPALILGFRRSGAAGWLGLPVFVFWLVLMSFIWLYLLGISNMVSGNFTPWEITMTIAVGIACVVGIAAFVRLRLALSVPMRILDFVALGAIQFVCFRLSFLPAVAHR